MTSSLGFVGRDICQKTSPRGLVANVPLSILNVLFKRIAVDIVGPIRPSSEKGHRYIVTLVD